MTIPEPESMDAMHGEQDSFISTISSISKPIRLSGHVRKEGSPSHVVLVVWTPGIKKHRREVGSR